MTGFDVDMPKIKRLTYRNLWTWAELSRRANVTTPTLYALQAGRRRASLRTVYKLAAALGVEPREIIKKN